MADAVFKSLSNFYNFPLDNIFSLNSVMRLDSTFFSDSKNAKNFIQKQKNQ